MNVERSSLSEVLVVPEPRDGHDPLLRALGGVGLAAVFGAAVGAASGPKAMLACAVQAPLTCVAALALGVPALYMVLALADAPVRVADMTSAGVRGLGTAGLVLAGLAPTVVVYATTSATLAGTRLVVYSSLLVAAFFGLRGFFLSLWSQLREATAGQKLSALMGSSVFTVFALLLGARVWHGAMAWVVAAQAPTMVMP